MARFSKRPKMSAEAPERPSNRRYIYCDAETIDAAISGKTKRQGGLDKEQIQLLMFEAGIDIDKVEYNYTSWNKPNRRKPNSTRNRRKNSKALRKMLKTVKQIVLAACCNPNQIYHCSWAANATLPSVAGPS